MKIDATGTYYKNLNEEIRKAARNGEEEIIVQNVNGQRYIGTGLKKKDLRIRIEGVPGNDLAAFMDGPTLEVFSNGQDAIGNTMNSGKVIIHGDAGDVVGHSMRGGKIYVKGDVGYRTGIHMKAYEDLFPVVIAGGEARDFLGEYMAGGLLIVLGLNGDSSGIAGSFVGTGMHGGEIFLRGEVENHQLGKEVGVVEPDEDDKEKLKKYLEEYAEVFGLSLSEIMGKDFVKLVPVSHRPYGKIYAY